MKLGGEAKCLRAWANTAHTASSPYWEVSVDYKTNNNEVTLIATKDALFFYGRDAPSGTNVLVRSIPMGIGEYRVGALITSTVPHATDTSVRKVTLDTGKWLITTAGNWASSFNNMSIHKIGYLGPSGYFNAASLVRNTGDAGGDFMLADIVEVSGTTDYYMRVYQISNSSQEISWTTMRAVRIA